ncbi:MAG: phosphate starvation-inducible protein PhoH, partial [Planctomycetes bacterium]|nr:phosphate starvation-inducible protein PhoH [Planctomycetota bacterium]
MSNRKIFVLDTNVLLHSAHSIDAFGDNCVVLPMS